MCLSTVFRGKEKKAYLAKLPDEITVWKVVYKHISGLYTTDYKHFPLHSGKVKFKQNIIYRGLYSNNYRGGGHFFKTRAAARRWQSSYERVIKCTIKKEWINTVGVQDGHVVLVVKRAMFPEFIGGVKC